MNRRVAGANEPAETSRNLRIETSDKLAFPRDMVDAILGVAEPHGLRPADET